MPALEDNDTLTAEVNDLQALDALIAAEEGKPGNSLNTAPQTGPKPATDDKPKAEAAPAADTDTPVDSKKPATTPEKPETPNPDDENDPNISRYEKAKRREANAWKEINRAKDEIKRAKEELEARQKAAPAPVAETPAASPAPKYSAQQYEDAAAHFDAQGKFDLADAARAEAQKLRSQPATAAQPQQPSAERQQFEQEQLKVWADTKKAFPELLDRGSDLHRGFTEFLGQHPDVLNYQQGPKLAAEFVAARLDAARVPAFREQVGQLQKRIAELERNLSPAPVGGKSSVSGEKAFEEMTSQEQEAALMREVAANSG